MMLMSIDNATTPRQAYWISREDWTDLENALFCVWVESTDGPDFGIISAVLADMGIAEARLESSAQGHANQWRAALGKNDDDLFISLSEEEKKAIQPALKYVTSDRLKKLLT